MISVLKSVYDRSGLPVAITDGQLSVIWKNKTSSPIFSEGEQLIGLFGGKIPDTGITNTISKGSLYSFNILKAEDRSENGLYFVIELVHSEKIINILNTPAVKDYILYLCSKIKNMAGMISNSADEIYDAISCGLFDGEMITDRLNVIDDGIMSITKEVIQPDQFYW